MSVDLEALKRANAEFQGTDWRVEHLIEFAQRELPAIVAALERAERVKAALMRCAEMGCVDPVEYVPYPASVIWRDCGKCPTCKARAALAAAPEGSDGYCQCSDMPAHDSGFCPQCGEQEARRG